MGELTPQELLMGLWQDDGQKPPGTVLVKAAASWSLNLSESTVNDLEAFQQPGLLLPPRFSI